MAIGLGIFFLNIFFEYSFLNSFLISNKKGFIIYFGYGIRNSSERHGYTALDSPDQTQQIDSINDEDKNN